MRSVARYLRSEPFAVVGAAIYAVIIAAALLAERIAPHSPTLPFQAIVRDDDTLSINSGSAGFAASLAFGAGVERGVKRRVNPAGCFVGVFVLMMIAIGIMVAVSQAMQR